MWFPDNGDDETDEGGEAVRVTSTLVQLTPRGTRVAMFEDSCEGSSHQWTTVTHECRVDTRTTAQRVLTVRQNLQRVPDGVELAVSAPRRRPESRSSRDERGFLSPPPPPPPPPPLPPYPPRPLSSLLSAGSR